MRAKGGCDVRTGKCEQGVGRVRGLMSGGAHASATNAAEGYCNEDDCVSRLGPAQDLCVDEIGHWLSVLNRRREQCCTDGMRYDMTRLYIYYEYKLFRAPFAFAAS